MFSFPSQPSFAETGISFGKSLGNQERGDIHDHMHIVKVWGFSLMAKACCYEVPEVAKYFLPSSGWQRSR